MTRVKSKFCGKIKNCKANEFWRLFKSCNSGTCSGAEVIGYPVFSCTDNPFIRSVQTRPIAFTDIPCVYPFCKLFNKRAAFLPFAKLSVHYVSPIADKILLFLYPSRAERL